MLSAQARASGRDPRPGARLEQVGDDEVRDLARAFNELLARLEDRQRQNEAFTADLVHEIKNPLATVRAAAEAIEGGTLEGARAARLARALNDAGARLDGIVSQFLELARAEGGWAADERVPIDLAALARRVADTCHARREEVALEVDAREPVEVNGVAHGLDAMVRNLIENAFSFAAPRGATPARVEVAVRKEAAFAELCVIDTGPGIPDNELARVFDRFFTTRGRERGTGLGLALVKAAVEAHGGTIAATSAATGTTFVVRIPLR
jgi:signal transduction histidine kinase